MPMVSSMALTRSQNASPGVGGNSAPAIRPKPVEAVPNPHRRRIEAPEAEDDEDEQAEQHRRQHGALQRRARKGARIALPQRGDLGRADGAGAQAHCSASLPISRCRSLSQVRSMTMMVATTISTMALTSS